MGLSTSAALRLSAKSIVRRRSVIPLLIALLIPSASIVAPLTMGSSFGSSLKESIYASLGEVDEVVRSQTLMREGVFDALKSDPGLSSMTDAIAPALIDPATAYNETVNRRDSQVDIMGVDAQISSFGPFKGIDGAILPPGIPDGSAYLVEDLADRLSLRAGDVVNVTFKDPRYSLESVYSPVAGMLHGQLRIKGVIKDEGLGALNLAPRSDARRLIYVNLGWLQDKIGQNGVNAILISNNGDARAGVDATASVTERVSAILNASVGYSEGGFNVTATGSYVKLENDKIFFDDSYEARVKGSDARIKEVSSQVSYFVNMIKFGSKWVSYSTVTGFDAGQDTAFGMFVENGSKQQISGKLAGNEIMVTNYTVERLGLKVGDKVTLNYTLYDRAFRKTFKYDEFTVKYVVNLEGKANDPGLMPPFPGIKGTKSCGDWKPPIPIDYSIMTNADLDYWLKHGGTPKAYISLSRGKQMWGNDLGNLTTIKALPASGTSIPQLAKGIEGGLNSSLRPGEMGVYIDTVKKTSLDSVQGMEIMTEALVAFGSAVTLSGMLLIYVLVQSHIESRRREIGTLMSSGFSNRSIVRLLAYEGAMLALCASVLGVLVGVAFAALGIWASNNLWSAILPLSSRFYLPDGLTMIIGFVAGAIVSTLSFVFGTHHASKGNAVSAMRDRPEVEESRKKKVRWNLVPVVIGIIISISALFAPQPYLNVLLLIGPPLVLTFASSRSRSIGTMGYLASIAWIIAYASLLSSSEGNLLLLYYFVSGDLLLLLTAYFIYLRLEALVSILSRRMRLGRISMKYQMRRIKRTGTYILAYAFVVFPLLTLSAYVPLQSSELSKQLVEQGGGYDIVGETDAPLFFDLGDANARASHGVTGFPNNTEVVQFLSYGNPGGTCSNLNSQAPPKLLAANSTFTAESKIPFAESIEPSRGWELLHGSSHGTPAIGDYTTVVWILGKGVGDTVHITDETGHGVELTIVALLHDSIFQGSVFVSERTMKQLYPTQSQYSYFLFKGVGTADTASRIEGSLASYGMRAKLVKDVVASNMKVELTYVSMLQALLIVGVIIGTFGFAAKVSKEVVERRFEIGVMRAVGVDRNSLIALMFGENLFILLLGFGVALLSAFIASILFLHMMPPLIDSLALLGILLGAVAIAMIAPLSKASRMSAAECIRISE
jgi:ABC-type lipoprotein release transport system permease subunit